MKWKEIDGDSMIHSTKITVETTPVINEFPYKYWIDLVWKNK